MKSPAAQNLRGWLRTLAPRPSATTRLYLFPHAGGGPAFFRDWTPHFGPEIELVAIQPPGREARLPEPLITEMALFSEPIAHEISRQANKPFAILGHSLGALVALEVVFHLRRWQARLPSHVVFSGSRAPRHVEDRTALCSLSDVEMRREMIKMGGTPQIVLENDEYFQLMLPSLRADLRIYETYRPSDNRPLDIPVLALGGQTDERTAIKELLAWSDVAGQLFECRVLPGGHFYLSDHRQAVASIVKNWFSHPNSMSIRDETVDLWVLPLDELVDPDIAATLSADEQLRASKFLRPGDRNRFEAARGMMRTILAERLGIAPVDIQFAIGPFGKPAIASSMAQGVHFNVSHSDGVGLLAIGQHELGVDIEAIRTGFEFDGIAMRFYSPRELEFLTSQSVQDQCDRFFDIWAGKEAYCKARGMGLQLPTDSYSVVPADGVPWSVDDPSISEIVRPRVYPLFTAPGFAAALASVAPVREIRVHQWKGRGP